MWLLFEPSVAKATLDDIKRMTFTKNMITLSYTTISNCLQPNNSHCWLNKTMGRVVPENASMANGRRLQGYIKEHQSEFPKLEGFTIGSPNFDESMKVSMPITTLTTQSFNIIGFVDGKKEDQLLEIKTGSKMWSIMDFYDSMQLRLYSLITGVGKFLCMTTISDENQWKIIPPKFYEIVMTQEMKETSRQWVKDAIEVFEKGEFKGGLDENGKCNIYCPYGENCYFKV